MAYSPLISKHGLGEAVAGVGLGLLVVLGSYYVQVRRIDPEPVVIGLCMAILIACILYINEFPDTAADSEKGRMHLVARWGKEEAARRYKYIIGSTYVVMMLGVVSGIVTPFALISLLSLPKAIDANKVLTKNYDKIMELIPGMANTVMATLWTGGLFLAGYVVAWIVLKVTGFS